MRKIGIFLALAVFGVLIAGCADSGSGGSSDGSSGGGSYVGKYKGTLTGNNETLYMILTINAGGTWSSQGYTDGNFTTTTNVGTASGGNVTKNSDTSISLSVSNGRETFTMSGITTDGWQTMTCSGLYTGTLTKQ